MVSIIVIYRKIILFDINHLFEHSEVVKNVAIKH